MSRTPREVRRYGDVMIHREMRTSWGNGMPQEECEVEGWRHYRSSDSQWYTWSEAAGYWLGDRIYHFHWWQRPTVAPGGYVQAGAVPGAMNSVRMDTPPFDNLIVVGGKARQAAGSTAVMNLEMNFTTLSAAALDFDGGTEVSETFPLSSPILMPAGRALQCMVTVGTFNGGFAIWYARPFAITAP